MTMPIMPLPGTNISFGDASKKCSSCQGTIRKSATKDIVIVLSLLFYADCFTYTISSVVGLSIILVWSLYGHD